MRKTLRYNGERYCSTLVCRCGKNKSFDVYAPMTAAGRPSVLVYAPAIADKITDAGWVERILEPHDLCPKCRRGER